MAVISVTSGQTSSGLVASGSTNSIVVFSGGITTSSKLLSGGSEVISLGGLASKTVISGGGSEAVFGVDKAAIVSSGGTLTVSSGGVASTTTMRTGGMLSVAAGGLVSAATISSGGSETVSSGGTGSATKLLTGGSETVFGLEKAAIVSSGGTLTVSSGGIASTTTVRTGGMLSVAAGGLVRGATISSGGSETVSSGGTGSATKLLTGGSETVFGLEKAAIVSSGGTLTVSSGGIASTTTVRAGGMLSVAAGGLVSGATISSGGSETVSSGGTGSATKLLTGGSETVFGLEKAAIVSSGGTLTVSSGGIASTTTVRTGGMLSVAAGGLVSGATISSGGSETVSSGSTGSATKLLTGGSETVFGLEKAAVVSSGGTLTVSSGGIADSPVISGGLLDVAVGGAVTGPVTFAGSGGELQIAGSVLPGNTISGLATGDNIDLTTIAFDSAGSAVLINSGSVHNQLQVTEGGNSYDLNLDPSQSFTGEAFQLASDGTSGTLITEIAACYCRGTQILTDKGEVPIERLAIGDRVQTLSGETRPIRWIGHRAYDGQFIRGNRGILPIRVAAGALDAGVPTRDLWVSPGHALYIDAILVPVEYLLNGAIIVQEEAVDFVEYYHIELDTHDIVIADGAPAESYIECNNRMMFANGQQYLALYPNNERESFAYCAPRPEWASPQVTAIRADLLKRTAEFGYAFDCDPDLHLLVDGEIVRAMSTDDRVHAFRVAAGCGAVWMVSHSAVPAETVAQSDDRRRLGVPIRQLVLRDAAASITVSHSHPAFRDGFHQDESTHRWTNGRGRLPECWLRSLQGEITIEVHLLPSSLPYRRDQQAQAA